MAEFDFAPRPPKQTDQTAEYTPFGSADPAQRQGAPTAGPKPGSAAGAGASAGRANGAAARSAARRNPAETSGMVAGLMSMATTLGMARHTTEHIDPMVAPSGLLSLLRNQFGAKHEQSDEHRFDLDLTRNGTAGGGIGGMNTGMGSVGGPLRAAATREATSSAMRAIGGMARAMGGGLNAMLGNAGVNTRHAMQWLDDGVKKLYKLDR